ncbi:MAG: hypothetical protein Q8M77_01845 [Hydrogenophaga sp.]|nr:hypothetical protein [Hydrogenophaga sp.]
MNIESDYRKKLIRRLVELAVEAKVGGRRYIFQNELDALIAKKHEKGLREDRARARGEAGVAKVRNRVIQQLNEMDIAAGRPLLTSLIVDGVKMYPPTNYFAVLAIRDRILLKTRGEDSERLVELHRAELERALEVNWRNVHAEVFKENL